MKDKKKNQKQKLNVKIKDHRKTKSGENTFYLIVNKYELNICLMSHETVLSTLTWFRYDIVTESSLSSCHSPVREGMTNNTLSFQ